MKKAISLVVAICIMLAASLMTAQTPPPLPGELVPIPTITPGGSPLTGIEEDLAREADRLRPDDLFMRSGGIETKGNPTLVFGKGMIVLPDGVWSDGIVGSIICMPDQECIQPPYQVFLRDGTDEVLLMRKGQLILGPDQNESKVREDFADVLELIEDKK